MTAGRSTPVRKRLARIADFAYRAVARPSPEAAVSQPAPTPPLATPVSPTQSRGRRLLRWVLPVLTLTVVAGVWQRERLWVWYCAERLERADDAARGEWGQKLAACGEPAVPALLGLLRHDEPGVCVAAKDALGSLAG